MNILVHATKAPMPKTRDAKRIAIFYAGILLVMAVAQLFTFDTFLVFFADFGLPGGTQFAYFLVTTEVFALPFLLRMSVSPAFRWVSMVCGWLAAGIWLGITVWLSSHDGMVNSVGFLGTVVDIIPGAWAVFMSIAFVLLAAWASWGMWPGKQESRKRK